MKHYGPRHLIDLEHIYNFIFYDLCCFVFFLFDVFFLVFLLNVLRLFINRITPSRWVLLFLLNVL